MGGTDYVRNVLGGITMNRVFASIMVASMGWIATVKFGITYPTAKSVILAISPRKDHANLLILCVELLTKILACA